VRYGDTDALGHINHAVYIAYFEAARAGYHARVTGHPFGTGPDAARTTFVIADAHITYRVPAFFGEPVVCEARVSWVSRSAFGMEYRVVSEGGPIAAARLVADGGTTQVMYDLVRGRPTRMIRSCWTLWNGSRAAPSRVDPEARTGPAPATDGASTRPTCRRTRPRCSAPIR